MKILKWQTCNNQGEQPSETILPCGGLIPAGPWEPIGCGIENNRVGGGIEDMITVFCWRRPLGDGPALRPVRRHPLYQAWLDSRGNLEAAAQELATYADKRGVDFSLRVFACCNMYSLRKARQRLREECRYGGKNRRDTIHKLLLLNLGAE